MGSYSPEPGSHPSVCTLTLQGVCGCICCVLLCGAGASAPAIAEHLMGLFRITTHTAAELVAKKRAESVASVQRPVSQGGPNVASLWYSGVKEAVRKLHSNGVDLALCTSNLRPIATAILEAGSMGGVFFKRIVQEDIGNEHMKPDPTPYIRAVSPAIHPHCALPRTPLCH